VKAVETRELERESGNQKTVQERVCGTNEYKSEMKSEELME